MTFTARGLYASSSKVRGRGRGPRWLLAIGGVLGVLALLWAAVGLLSFATTSDDERSESFGEVATLAIDNGTRGDVNVSPAPAGEQLSVTRVVQESLMTSARHEVEESADALSIEASCSGWNIFDTCAVDYEVRVPADTELVLENTNGDITVSGTQSATNIRTTNGDVTLEDVAGDVSAETSNGTLELEDVTGSLDLRSTTGDINASGSGEAVDISSTTGDIDISEFSAARVAVENTTGGLELRAGSEEMSVETTTGDVDVVAPAEFRHILVEATTGEVTVSVPEGSGPFRVTDETTTGEAEIGVASDPEAEAHIEVATTTGDVEVTER